MVKSKAPNLAEQKTAEAHAQDSKYGEWSCICPSCYKVRAWLKTPKEQRDILVLRKFESPGCTTFVLGWEKGQVQP